MRQFDDADQAVSIVALLFFLDAALNKLTWLFRSIGTPDAYLLIPLGLIALQVAAAVGLLKQRRWAWPLAVVAGGLLLIFSLLSILSLSGLIGVAFDVLVLYLLFRPAVRERFGVGERFGRR